VARTRTFRSEKRICRRAKKHWLLRGRNYIILEARNATLLNKGKRLHTWKNWVFLFLPNAGDAQVLRLQSGRGNGLITGWLGRGEFSRGAEGPANKSSDYESGSPGPGLGIPISVLQLNLSRGKKLRLTVARKGKNGFFFREVKFRQAISAADEPGKAFPVGSLPGAGARFGGNQSRTGKSSLGGGMARFPHPQRSLDKTQRPAGAVMKGSRFFYPGSPGPPHTGGGGGEGLRSWIRTAKSVEFSNPDQFHGKADPPPKMATAEFRTDLKQLGWCAFKSFADRWRSFAP